MEAFGTAEEVDVKSDHKNRLLLCGVPCVLSYLHGLDTWKWSAELVHVNSDQSIIWGSNPLSSTSREVPEKTGSRYSSSALQQVIFQGETL